PRLTAPRSSVHPADPRLTAPHAGAAQQPQFAHPAHDDDGPHAGRSEWAARTSRAPGKPHVLHVDHDDECASMVAGLLAPEVHVTRVSSLVDARRAIANDIYSLVIIDPYLPDGNGSSLLPSLDSTPVLVHTENSPPWRDRVQGYLPKPWSTHRVLWREVSALLGLSNDLAAEG
ncbi:response regulator, partial [Zemynaea arenosa]|uniref:response regulator n=1 Tax=Zemynaea arenosa TaxID=2561931 RepID=UPI001431F963